MSRIEVVRGDITGLDVDAVVNAANEALAPGGGVCGAIHRAAGPELARECAAIGHCPTGDACITMGYRLKARHVIHAVGPVWRGGASGEPELLARCYRNSLALAADRGIRSIAFPAISTGIYGFPLGPATDIAVAETRRFLADNDLIARVIFARFDATTADRYRSALSAN